MHAHPTFQNFRFSVFQLLPKHPRLDAAIQNKYSRAPEKLTAEKNACGIDATLNGGTCEACQ